MATVAPANRVASPIILYPAAIADIDIADKNTMNANIINLFSYSPASFLV